MRDSNRNWVWLWDWNWKWSPNWNWAWYWVRGWSWDWDRVWGGYKVCGNRYRETSGPTTQGVDHLTHTPLEAHKTLADSISEMPEAWKTA